MPDVFDIYKKNVKIIFHILYKMPLTVHLALGNINACVLITNQYETVTWGLSTIFKYICYE